MLVIHVPALPISFLDSQRWKMKMVLTYHLVWYIFQPMVLKVWGYVRICRKHLIIILQWELKRTFSIFCICALYGWLLNCVCRDKTFCTFVRTIYVMLIRIQNMGKYNVNFKLKFIEEKFSLLIFVNCQDQNTCFNLKIETEQSFLKLKSKQIAVGNSKYQ